MTDKKFEELKEAINSLSTQSLEEASLSRVMDHVKDRNVGMISANRQASSPETNNKNHEALKADIKAHGFGYTHVKGVFPEKQADGSTKPGNERTFLITAPKEHKAKLHDFLVKHGKKYDQDSIFFKGHDEEDAHLHTTTQRTKDDSPVGHKMSVGKFHPNKLSDYMTKLKGNRSFTFSEAIVEWHDGFLGEWKKSLKS